MSTAFTTALNDQWVVKIVCLHLTLQSGNGGGSALCSQVAAALSASLGAAGKPLSWLGRVAISYRLIAVI